MQREQVEKALAGYSYRTHSRSLLYGALKRYWYMPALKLVPRSVPANALTVIAGAFSLAAFFLCLLVAEHHELSIGLLGAGLLWWLRDLLDNLDGAQARRTGTSGPLGELLDHGIDAYTVFLMPLGICLAFGFSPAMTVILVGLSAIAFWVTMWEQHHTGVMHTGVLSDIEASLSACAFLTVTGILGRDVMLEPLVGGIAVTDMVAWFAVFGFVVQIAGCLWRVRGRSLVQVIPAVALQAMLFLWFLTSNGDVPMMGIALLMGVAGAHATRSVITRRVLGKEGRWLDPFIFGVAGIGLVASLAGGPLAAHQAWVAWTGIVVLCVLEAARSRAETAILFDVTGARIFRMPKPSPAAV